MRPTTRTRAAITLGRAAAWASRTTGRGAGEVVGGKVILRLSPLALVQLSDGRPIACVSGTNGKTTTTRLLAAAVGAETSTNSGGANMPAGVVTALAAKPAGPAVLEVDELHLPAIALAVTPDVIALLNLSRDQLDRASETRRIAGLWRDLGAQLPDTVVVANADDPLIVWAASRFAHHRWVGAGQAWTSDAMVCPSCAQLLRRQDQHWWCPSCGLQRPPTALDAGDVDIVLALPGRCNVANAAMALVAAQELTGVDKKIAAQRMSGVTAVAGRYATVTLAGRQVRLLLAKNPAGWIEMLDLLGETALTPVVIHFHARTADGRDPSWIWDVPVSLLGGRPVLVSGERAEDVLVRLRYAGIEAALHPDLDSALSAAPEGPIDVLATYTAFREAAVRGRGGAVMRIGLVYPELLGTYGDGGNAEVLLTRAAWRGITAEIVDVPAGDPVPGGCDLYVLGGGEDEPQVLAAAGLYQSPDFTASVQAGAVVLAVCAGFQLVGKSFPGAEGATTAGLGLLDVETVRTGEPRAVGDLAVQHSELGLLTGYENHAGRTRPLPGASGAPLGRVLRGIGNGFDEVEGWVAEIGAGLILGTYLHGPALPQNPHLADWLLSRALHQTLMPLDPDPAAELVAARHRDLGLWVHSPRLS